MPCHRDNHEFARCPILEEFVIGQHCDCGLTEHLEMGVLTANRQGEYFVSWSNDHRYIDDARYPITRER